MYMLKKAIAQKRSEKYLRKQKHLAALKWRKEHPVEKKKVTLTAEEIEKKKKKILAIRRKIWHKKALDEKLARKRTLHRFNEAKAKAALLTKKAAQKGLKKSVRCALARKAARANAKVAKVPAIIAKPPVKKAKVEKKPAAKVEKKATKAQAKK